MNIFTFGMGLVVITILLINVAPIFSDGVNNVDSQNPDIDDNTIALARTFPFMITIGVVILLSFFWWRGGLD